MNKKIKNEYIDFIKNYSKINYREDWKLCVDLCYKFDVYNDKLNRKWIGNLKKYLNDNNIKVDGFVVKEYDVNFSKLHNHILLWGNKDWSYLKSKIYNYWNKIGSVNIEKYDSKKFYSTYIMKHVGKNDENDWDLLINYQNKI